MLVLAIMLLATQPSAGNLAGTQAAREHGLLSRRRLEFWSFDDPAHLYGSQTFFRHASGQGTSEDSAPGLPTIDSSGVSQCLRRIRGISQDARISRTGRTSSPVGTGCHASLPHALYRRRHRLFGSLDEPK